jgi:hypothetical protein
MNAKPKFLSKKYGPSYYIVHIFHNIKFFNNFIHEQFPVKFIICKGVQGNYNQGIWAKDKG